MATLVAPIPSSGLTRAMTPRNLGASFGDGYGETVPDGINTLLMKLEPRWTLLSFAEGDALNLFLSQQHGKSFYWKLPREAGLRRWKCPEWSFVEGSTTSEISAKFEEQPPL